MNYICELGKELGDHSCRIIESDINEFAWYLNKSSIIRAISLCLQPNQLDIFIDSEYYYVVGTCASVLSKIAENSIIISISIQNVWFG